MNSRTPSSAPTLALQMCSLQMIFKVDVKQRHKKRILLLYLSQVNFLNASWILRQLLHFSQLIILKAQTHRCLPPTYSVSICLKFYPLLWARSSIKVLLGTLATQQPTLQSSQFFGAIDFNVLDSERKDGAHAVHWESLCQKYYLAFRVTSCWLRPQDPALYTNTKPLRLKHP